MAGNILGTAVIDVSANLQSLQQALQQANQMVERAAKDWEKKFAAPAVTFPKQMQQAMQSMAAPAVTFKNQMEKAFAAPAVTFPKGVEKWQTLPDTFSRLEHSTRGSALGFLALSQAVEDAQYGFSAIVNNIPMIVLGLGGGPGLAGVLSLAAVATNVMIQHWDQLKAAMGDSFLKGVAEEIQSMIAVTKKLGQEITNTTDEAEKFREKEGKRKEAAASIKDIIAEPQRITGEAFKAMGEKIGGEQLFNKLMEGSPASRTAGPKLDEKELERQDYLVKRQKFLQEEVNKGMFGARGPLETVTRELDELGKKARDSVSPFERLRGELKLMYDAAVAGDKKMQAEFEKKVSAIPELNTLFEQSFPKAGGPGPGKDEAMRIEKERQDALDKGLKDFFSKGKEQFHKRESEREKRAAERRADDQKEEQSWDKFYNAENRLRNRIAEMQASQAEKKELGQSFGLAEFRQKMQKDIMGDDTAKRHLEIAKAQLAELHNIASKEQEALLNKFGHAMGPE